ncbi:helix-turn-helix domain-containing protein [Phaeobacter piscinae]|uniref:Helix-turn-helix domain protein n=1 Tax=Phaeobacter piscinae TaxID=1580596 RepID=A0AAN1GRG0_9RHOB|nr:helix-turn-helix domain-containing protein [Phaeobacter piscinae]ATG43688.1 Helix-turn-helix domain protein [Phaeobacter piscinae]
MSHKATNWLADINPKDLTNAEFRILFVLCDCHNPSAGCFPKQSYIMAKTGRGSSSVNDALTGLEGKGFIRREQRTNPKTGKREATRYILGFEMDGAQEPSPNSGDGRRGSKPEQTGAPTPNSGDGSISGFSADPSPVFGQNHLRKTGVVYKEEPVKEPVKEPCAADAPHKSEFDFDGFVAEFSAAYPRMGLPEATENALRAALGEGADPAEILAGARAYAVEQDGNAPRYVKLSENWIAEKRWRQHVTTPKAQADQSEVLAYWAKEILEAKPHMRGRVSPSMARECLSAGLVTEQDCRQVGVSL